MKADGERGGVVADDAAEHAREAVERYGDHAADYVESRIEASQTSGESDDVEMWQRASELVSEQPDQG